MRKPRLTHWDSNKKANILQMHFLPMKIVARIFNEISLNLNCRGHIGSSLAQVVAWRREGDKPLPEPMMTRPLTLMAWSRQATKIYKIYRGHHWVLSALMIWRP